MRVCGLQRHFRLLTANHAEICGAPVPSKLVDIAVCEEKVRALNITAAWLAVDRWNYIINGACVRMTQDGLPVQRVSAVCA